MDKVDMNKTCMGSIENPHENYGWKKKTNEN
jgi:hypothetical protein